MRFLPAVVVAKRRSSRHKQAESERRCAADAGVAPIEPIRPLDDLYHGRLRLGDSEDEGVPSPAACLRLGERKAVGVVLETHGEAEAALEVGLEGAPVETGGV